MPDRLFQCEGYGIQCNGINDHFHLPVRLPIQKVRFAIQRLLATGCHVVAYQSTMAVFTQADPMILPELVGQVQDNTRSR